MPRGGDFAAIINSHLQNDKTEFAETPMHVFGSGLPDENVQKIDEGKLYEGREDGAEADDDEHVQGCCVSDLKLRFLFFIVLKKTNMNTKLPNITLFQNATFSNFLRA